MSTHHNIIITGFKPFSRFDINSSWESAKAAKRKRNDIHIQELTVDHLSAHHEVMELLSKNHCDILILSGLADYDMIKLETRASKPQELSLIEGPPELNGHWHWKENLTVLNRLGIPASASDNAGAYVCETSYWSALNFRRLNGYPNYVAFFHVPVLSPVWNEEFISDALILSAELHNALLNQSKIIRG